MLDDGWNCFEIQGVSQLALLDLVHLQAGQSIFVREVDASNPDDIHLLIANSRDPLGEAVCMPLNAFLQAHSGASFNYIATDKPIESMAEISHGFDEEKGFFTATIDWLLEQAPGFVTGAVSILIGEEIGELLDSEAATIAGHFATEKLIETVTDHHTDENQQQVSTITCMTSDEKLDMMRKL